MDTDVLLDRIAAGEPEAVGLLLMRHEPRLRRMVRSRLDPRLAPRVDPSDVVQETMAEAHLKLRCYASDRPIPFYAWLRGIAWDKLVGLIRRHIHAQRRSIHREVNQLELSGDSQRLLVKRMLAISTTPSQAAIRREVNQRVRSAINQLAPRDHEVIVLKHLEELTVPEIAAVLGIGEEAVNSRYRRAVQRLHHLLNDE